MRKRRATRELIDLVDKTRKEDEFDTFSMTISERNRYQRLRKKQSVVVSSSGHYQRKGRGAGKLVCTHGYNQGHYGLLVGFRVSAIQALLQTVAQASDTLNVGRLNQKDVAQVENNGMRMKALFPPQPKQAIVDIIAGEMGQWWPKREFEDPLLIWCEGNAPRQQDHVDAQFQSSSFSSLLINLSNCTQFIYFGGNKVERKVAIYPHCCLMFADQAHHAGREGQDGLLRLHARVNKIGQGSKSRRHTVLY